MENLTSPDRNTLKCIDGPDGCAGTVENRWPGHYPRCERHAEQRLEREHETRERYPGIAPRDFDPSDAGESWTLDD